MAVYKENVITAVKEIARLVVFAIPGIAIQVISGDAALSSAYGGIILLALKGVDKSIHDDPINPSTGILPF